MRHLIVDARACACTSVGLLLCACLAACGGGGAVPSNGHKGPGGGVGGPPVRDDWPMYGHDARHTSASQANVPGALTVAWRYDPQAASGNTFNQVYSAIANVNAVYVHWFQQAPTILGAGPSVDAVSTGGAPLWSFIEKRDYDEGHWLSIFTTGVVLEDDGEPLIDANTGKETHWLTSSFDVWGETIPDASGLYGANTFKADGPDLFVWQVNPTTYATTWKALQQKSVKYDVDSNGAILLANGTLYYAANYTSQTPNASGLYALNATSGSVGAYVNTTVLSDMSADSSQLYLVESPNNLVARNLSNLQKVWSVSLTFGASQAPVIANGLVIVASFNGIEAHDPGTGKVVWTNSSVQPAGGGLYSTSMCAALASNTLVVTAGDGIHVLNLSNGTDLWHGAVSGVVGTPSNPIIVNNPASGATVYVTDGRGVIALTPH